MFIVTEVRATNLSASTIDSVARAVMVAHQIFDFQGIDLNARLAEGRVLEISEVDELAKLAGYTQKALDALVRPVPGNPKTCRVVPLEKVRMGRGAQAPISLVDTASKSTRLLYIRKYIAWLANRALLKLDRRAADRRSFDAAKNVMLEAIAARTPVLRVSSYDPKQGVGPEMRARILDVIHPDSAENLWRSQHVRERNQLIILWLLLLGLRVGELLGVKVTNVNFRAGEVFIPRNADDPEETRATAPLTKTKARLLVLDEDLLRLTQDYVVRTRRTLAGAKKHGFLFVANGTGAPLSLSAVRKLFGELRTKVPGLPEELTPHILRHTWNDDFSELMDSRGVAPEEEERLRKQAMGWSDASKMAAAYTRRHVRRKANEASLAMQKTAFKKPALKK